MQRKSGKCRVLVRHGGVSQTRCDSIDYGLFTERSSEQDQLNIHYGRSIPAQELSNELDISLASLPAGAWPLKTSLPAAFSFFFFSPPSPPHRPLTAGGELFFCGTTD